VIALVAALALATSDVAAGAVLPPGSYRYQIYSESKPVATTTIVVTHSHDTIGVAESLNFQDEPVSTLRTLDPANFSTLAYTITSRGSKETIGIADKSATYRNEATATTKTLAETTDGPAIALDFFVGPYVALPAMLHATAATTFNAYCICFVGFNAETGTLVQKTMVRPAGVPATDAQASIDFEDAIFTVWYDPVTFVLSEFDAPTAKVRMALLR